MANVRFLVTSRRLLSLKGLDLRWAVARPQSRQSRQLTTVATAEARFPNPDVPFLRVGKISGLDLIGGWLQLGELLAGRHRSAAQPL
jgi:hypothetical protein